MPHATRIIGCGFHIPEREITNRDVLKMMFESSKAYLSKREQAKILEKAEYKLDKAGSKTRFWCREDEYCTDIAKRAAVKALEDAGIEPTDIDLIIFTGMSKAFIEPATAHVLRNELGAENANVFDTQDACTSFMKSVQIADALIKTGTYRNVLIASGERSFDWADFSCKTLEELSWKFGSLVIGDGAGALVLQATQERRYLEHPHHMKFKFKLTNGSYSYCHIGLNYKFGIRYRLHSHSSRLFNKGLMAMHELLKEMTEDKIYEDFAFDNIFIHDIGKMVDDLVIPQYRDIPLFSKAAQTYRPFFSEYGNMGSASLPVALSLAKMENRTKAGNAALFVCPSAGVQAGMMTFLV